LPNKLNLARYRAIQDVQDRLSAALRDVFSAQRALANR
jgi:hypothetical protein